MAYDAHVNFAYSTVATAPSPATSGTSLTVATGDGAKFPAAPFNATVWPAGSQPTASNCEIVRVTAISTDTFTITRTQETSAGGPSSARSITVGDQIAATITAKTLTDIEANATGGGGWAPGVGKYHYQMPLATATDGYITNTAASVSWYNGLDITCTGTSQNVAINAQFNTYPTGLWSRALYGKMIFNYLPTVAGGMKLFARFGTQSTYSASYALVPSVGIRYDAATAKVFASVANGTSETTADITSSFSLNSFTTTVVDVVFTPATNCKFYVNEALAATISATLPSGNTGNSRDGLAAFYLAGPSTGSSEVRLSHMEVWQ